MRRAPPLPASPPTSGERRPEPGSDFGACFCHPEVRPHRVRPYAADRRAEESTWDMAGGPGAAAARGFDWRGRGPCDGLPRMRRVPPLPASPQLRGRGDQNPAHTSARHLRRYRSRRCGGTPGARVKSNLPQQFWGRCEPKRAEGARRGTRLLCRTVDFDGAMELPERARSSTSPSSFGGGASLSERRGRVAAPAVALSDRPRADPTFALSHSRTFALLSPKATLARDAASDAADP
jgi:hypothetical protein